MYEKPKFSSFNREINIDIELSLLFYSSVTLRARPTLATFDVGSRTWRELLLDWEPLDRTEHSMPLPRVRHTSDT